MSDDDDDLDFDDDTDEEDLPITSKQTDARKRFLREQIELRKMAKDLGLSLEDYLEAFGER
jgi:hypothetical protein